MTQYQDPPHSTPSVTACSSSDGGSGVGENVLMEWMDGSKPWVAAWIRTMTDKLGCHAERTKINATDLIRLKI